MHRTALIEQIQQARKTLEKLLTLLQSAPVERDHFVSTYIGLGRLTDERAKPPESPASRSSGCLISTFREAESMGFKDDFRAWEHLLRIGD
jgi:hypothetical protein